MERYSRKVYSMETQKFEFIFKKISKLNFDFWQRAEIT